jgi:hypothetical protein
MQAVMARIRITIDTEEVFKRAFLSAANIAGLTPQEFFEKLVTENCREDVERARKAVERSDAGESGDQRPKGKPKK